MSSISDFKSNFTGGGARSNLFRVLIMFPAFVPTGMVAGQKLQFLCHGAELPASKLNNLTVSFQGRPVNLAGERAAYEPLELEIYNDTDFNIRDAFEAWVDVVQNAGSLLGLSNPYEYQVDLAVQQLDRDGSVIKEYGFIDAYPTDVGAITLSFDANGTAIETFKVSMPYNYFETPELPSVALGL